jgi:uncharacterized protein YjbI with pentapeptide repeats
LIFADLEWTKVTVAEMLARYARGDRNFSHSELPDDSCLRGVDLSRAVFDNSWIDNADFAGANLSGASFKYAHLKCCRFDGADLSSADLSEAGIDSATFIGAHMEGALFAGATAYGGVLKDELPRAAPVR